MLLNNNAMNNPYAHNNTMQHSHSQAYQTMLMNGQPTQAANNTAYSNLAAYSPIVDQPQQTWAPQQQQTLAQQTWAPQQQMWTQAQQPSATSMWNGTNANSQSQAMALAYANQLIGMAQQIIQDVTAFEFQDFAPALPNASFVDGATDIFASNGVIQAVDQVLIPFDLNPNAPTDTIADIVEASGGIFDDNRDDFDILFQALQATDLLDVFDQANLNATVLAPTDQAFVNLAQNLVGDDVTIDTEEEALNAIIDGLNEITDGEAIDAIADVLSYHVLAGQLTAEDIILRGLNFTNLGLPFQVIPNSI